MQINPKRQNHQGHSEADSKLGVLGQKKKDRNMKTGDNAKSWAVAPNYKRIGKGAKEIFLGRDGKIIRAIT